MHNVTIFAVAMKLGLEVNLVLVAKELLWLKAQHLLNNTAVVYVALHLDNLYYDWQYLSIKEF